MSKERELLERWLDDTIFEPEELDSLMEETRELLAQPEQRVKSNRVFYQEGYAQAELNLKREPLIYEHLEDLVDKYHGYPMTLGRAIEKAHGITGGEE